MDVDVDVFQFDSIPLTLLLLLQSSLLPASQSRIRAADHACDRIPSLSAPFLLPPSLFP